MKHFYPVLHLILLSLELLFLALIITLWNFNFQDLPCQVNEFEEKLEFYLRRSRRSAPRRLLTDIDALNHPSGALAETSLACRKMHEYWSSTCQPHYDLTDANVSDRRRQLLLQFLLNNLQMHSKKPENLLPVQHPYTMLNEHIDSSIEDPTAHSTIKTGKIDKKSVQAIFERISRKHSEARKNSILSSKVYRRIKRSEPILNEVPVCSTIYTERNIIRAPHSATGQIVSLYTFTNGDTNETDQRHTQKFDEGLCVSELPLSGFVNLASRPRCKEVMTRVLAYINVNISELATGQYLRCFAVNAEKAVCRDWIQIRSNCKLFAQLQSK